MRLDPILAYGTGAEISQLQRSATKQDWITIAFSESLQILRVELEEGDGVFRRTLLVKRAFISIVVFSFVYRRGSLV